MGASIKIVILLLSLIALTTVNLLWGSVSLNVGEVVTVLLGDESAKRTYTIVWMFRMPKILSAIVAGASLAVSGLLMQTFFRNPIAGPFVLGVSSGASLGVALFLLTTGGTFVLIGGKWGLILMAMLGAGAVLFLLLIVSYRIADMNTLLILGLMLGSATGAVVALLQYFSSQQSLQQFVLWSMGDLTGVTWEELYFLFPIGGITIIGSLGLSKPMDLLLMGNQYAQSMGVNVRFIQQVIILLTAVLAGAVTAFCGPIAFVGIAVPHLARLLFKTHKHLILLITTALLGMITLLFCQLIAQLPGTNQMLPINVVTSFMGAPMVIWIVWSNRRRA